eukprot:1020574-Heterocapsa_arctica.AAC.1
MHKVPEHLEREVGKQDAMAESLLRMTLNVMENVHDKAPVRKKEEKQAHEEVQRKFQGPKTGPHGELTLSTKKEGAGGAPRARSSPPPTWAGID